MLEAMGLPTTFKLCWARPAHVRVRVHGAQQEPWIRAESEGASESKGADRMV